MEWCAMKTVYVIYGTRPELIKLVPVIWALKESKTLQVVTCATGQHRELLDQMQNFFEIKPDLDLNIMQPEQTLWDLTARCFSAIGKMLVSVSPDLVLVQGDTTTAFVASLCAYYRRIPLAHVEAGLRTENKYSPFPEEVNRRLITRLADYHFAPTASAVTALFSENVYPKRIFCVGNTCIDTLLWTSRKIKLCPHLQPFYAGKKMILLTTHRRENLGPPMDNILAAVQEFAKSHLDFQILFPVHPNPNIKQRAEGFLKDLSNVSLLPPMDYGETIFLLRECHFLMTDSGGLQEEAPTFGKPTLVLRQTTERGEAIQAGGAVLVGHDKQKILMHMQRLVDPSGMVYRKMCLDKNPFGDGKSATRIVNILEEKLHAHKQAA